MMQLWWVSQEQEITVQLFWYFEILHLCCIAPRKQNKPEASLGAICDSREIRAFNEFTIKDKAITVLLGNELILEPRLGLMSINEIWRSVSSNSHKWFCWLKYFTTWQLWKYTNIFLNMLVGSRNKVMLFYRNFNIK